jgi:hypothetical protein
MTDRKTTYSAVATAIVWILARFGIDGIPVELADAVIVAGMMLIGYFARDKKPKVVTTEGTSFQQPLRKDPSEIVSPQ